MAYPILMLLLVGILALIVTTGPTARNNVVLFWVAVFAAFMVGLFAISRAMQLAVYDAAAGPLFIAAAISFTGAALCIAFYSRKS